MRKIYTLLVAMSLCLSATFSQTPAIIFTTSNAVGSTITFDLGTNPASTVQVDFGDGTLVPKAIGTSLTIISGTLVGSQTVKIYGTLIDAFKITDVPLTSLDVSNDAALTQLLCYRDQLTTLDVSKNVALTELVCFQNQLTSLDVSNNTALTLLACSDNKLTSLDVTKNTALTTLNCYYNDHMTTLDVSKNTALTQLCCEGNHLSVLDVTNNTALTTLTCWGNRLTFTSLPLKQASWISYLYASQKPIAISKSVGIGNTIDLSSQLSINGNTTLYKWKTIYGVSLTEGTDYTLTSGKTVFLKAQTDSIYCEMTNATFPDFADYKVLKSSNTKVMVPAISMTTSNAIGSSIYFTLASNANNTPIKVDFGDGNLVSKTIGIENATITGNIVGSQTIKIYGTGITYLDCHESQLTALDVTKNPELSQLDCRNNQIALLDVTNNIALTQLRCSDNKLTALNVSANVTLTDLWCFDNQLTALDVTKNTALKNLFCYSNILTALDVTKNTTLVSLYCNNNKLTTLDVTKLTLMVELSCHDNMLTDIDLSKNTALTMLRGSSNQFTVLDVSKNTKLYDIECEYNQLTALDVSKNTALTDLYCDHNQLTFATLPLKQAAWTTYTYAPQTPISINKAIGVNVSLDLSSQLTINGNTTVYTWKTKGGTTLVEGTDYTLTIGKTVFLKVPADSVYCEMTNTTFPNFNGSDVLKTTNVKVTGTTDVEDIKTSEPEIYSHNKILYINLAYNAQCSVFDINSRLIISKPVYEGSNRLQLQNSGVYLVKITRNKDIVTKKVIVQ